MSPRSPLPTARLLEAYRHGWFPMGQPGTSRVEWFSPDPRGIVPLEGYHVSHRLARVLRQQRFRTSIDTAFPAVLQACATMHGESWISEAIAASYTVLHEQGHAHSIEVWRDGDLAGGLYGVAIGGAFFGESMFHRVTDASKVAFDALVTRLQARGFALLDIQWLTPHLAQFGAIEVPRHEYLRQLRAACDRACTFA